MKKGAIHCKACKSREQSIFCVLSPKHLEKVGTAKITNDYKSHQVLFYEGNQPYGLYCLCSGKVKVYKMDTEGHQKIVRLAGPGDILGYRCLLANEVYTATAETIETATICFIDKATFDHILENHPLTASHMMRLLATDLGKAEQDSLNMAHKNIRERLAELLLIFKNRFGEKNKNGVELNLSLSRQELAECIGTTQESVIRTISEFRKEKLIEEKGHRLTLVNISALVHTANLSE